MLDLELSMQNQEDRGAAIDDAMEYVNHTVKKMEEEREITPEMAAVYHEIGEGTKGKAA